MSVCVVFVQMLVYKNDKQQRNLMKWQLETKVRELEAKEAELLECIHVREAHSRLTLKHFALQCDYDKLKDEYDQLNDKLQTFGDITLPLPSVYEEVTKRRHTSFMYHSLNHGVTPVPFNCNDGDDNDNDDIEVDMVVGLPGLLNPVTTPRDLYVHF